MAVIRTPQEFPGPQLEDKTIYYDQYGTLPSEKGSVVYSDGYFYFRDGYEIYTPLSARKHENLRQLIHFIDDGPTQSFSNGSFREILPLGDPFPTQVVWWESSSKIRKILETNITRNANKMPYIIEWVLFDSDGTTILESVTDNITYINGVFEQGRTRTIL